MEPLIFIEQIPEFLRDPDSFDPPDPGPDIHVTAKKLGWSPEDLEEATLDANKWWGEKMEEHTLTKLRAVYLKELENSDSPLAQAAWENHGIFDRELCEHITALWKEQDCTHVEWVEFQFEGEDMEEQDEEGEDMKEQNEGMGREESMELDAVTEVGKAFDEENHEAYVEEREPKQRKDNPIENLTDDGILDELMMDVD